MFNANPGNPDLRWETVRTIDASVEIGLWENHRVAVEVGLYNKLASDVLMNVELPPTLASTTALSIAGEVLNQGIELESLPTTSRAFLNCRKPP